MFRNWLNNAATGIFRVAKQVCLVAGLVCVGLAFSTILVPFAVGLALLAVAKWAADREAQQAPLVVVPVSA